MDKTCSHKNLRSFRSRSEPSTRTAQAVIAITGRQVRLFSEVPTKERYACTVQFQLSKVILPARVH
jgi:hypothetical protein